MSAESSALDQLDWLRLALRQGSRPFVRVTSNSMAPLLRKDDYAQIASAELGDLQPNDIVVTASDSGPVSHRLWRLQAALGQELVTRGDRLDHFDPPRSAGDLIGRVVACRRNSRVLNLESGAGLRLRLMTGRLARVEHRLTSALSSPSPQRTRQQSRPPEADDDHQSSWPTRVSRLAQVLSQLLYRAAQLATWIAYAMGGRSVSRRMRP